MRRELFKLGARINGFVGIENSLDVSLKVLVEESERIHLGNMEVVKALFMICS